MLPKPTAMGQSGVRSPGNRSPNSNNNNNNNNNSTIIPNKRNYPFEEKQRSERKIAKICENSFRPLVQKVFPDSEIIKLRVRHGALPGDNFTSAIYAIEAHLKSPRRVPLGAYEDSASSVMIINNENSTAMITNNIEQSADNAAETVQIIHLLMKCFPSHPARQDFFRKIGIFKTELDVYRCVLPELIQFQMERLADNDKLNVEPSKLLAAFPHFYGGAYDDNYHRYWEDIKGVVAHGNFILLEDLRRTENYRMPSKYVGLDLAHCTLVVRELAKLHALSMAYIKVKLGNSSSLCDRFECLRETVITPQTEESASTLFNASFGTSIRIVMQETGSDSIYSEKMRQFGNRVPWIFGHILAGNSDHMSLSEMLRVKPNFEDLHDQNKERKRDNWFVLNHGDCYVNNILFKYDPTTKEPTSVKFVDLQMARENSLTIDLVSFIYLSTTPAFRKENLEKILEEYYHSFTSYCKVLGVEPYPDFTLANLWMKFNRAKIWGMIQSLFVLPVLLADANEEDKEIIALDQVDEKTGGAMGMFNRLLKQGARSNEKLYTRVVQLVAEMVEESVI